MTTTPSTGLGINFAAIAGEDSANPQGVAEKTLSRIDPSKPLESFSCRVDLSDAELDSVRTFATKLLVDFKADRTKLSSFGDSAMDGLNSVVTLILNQQGNLEIPDIERITKEMAKTVANFRKKYKDADPRLLEAMDKFVDSIRGLFQSGNRFFRELQIDSQTAVQRLDGVAGKLVENKYTLDRNVLLCDQLYEQNEAGLVNLIGTIAMMEQVLEDLGNETAGRKLELDAMPQGKSTARRNKEEELDVLLEMLEELETRRIEFVSRLYIAYATSPEIRNLRKVSNSLSQRLHLLVVLTIPTMKLTIAKWGMQLQAVEAARAGAAVADANNAALQEFAEASGEDIGALAMLSQTPTVTPQTIFAIADSIVKQDEGFVTALIEGQRMRANLEDTVVKSMRLISESGDNRQAKIIELVANIQGKHTPALEAAPEIPEQVLEYAEKGAA